MQNNLQQMISSMMKGTSGNPMNMFMSMMQQQNPQMAKQLQAFAQNITPEQAKNQVAQAIQNGQVSKQQMLQLQHMFNNMNMGEQYEQALKELNVDINQLDEKAFLKKPRF